MHNRLKTIRKTLNLKQGAFAEKLGILPNSLSGIERGTRNFTVQLLLALDKFGVNLHWLISGSGSMFLPENEIPEFQKKDMKKEKNIIMKEFQNDAAIKDRVKLIRKTLNLDYRHFSSKIGISSYLASKIESGEKNLPPKTFPKLLDLGINLDWLFFGKGEMFKSESLVNIPDPKGEFSEVIQLLSKLPEERQKECLNFIQERKLLIELQEKLGKNASF